MISGRAGPRGAVATGTRAAAADLDAGENSTRRSLPVSATSTSPAAVTARPSGAARFSVASAVFDWRPNSVSKVPSGPNTLTTL